MKRVRRSVGTGLNSRGVAFWKGEDGETRIFVAGRQRLFAVNARTGQAISTFGSSGSAALNVDLGREVLRLHTQSTSPPVVYKNLVIVGSGVPDRLEYRGDPPGTVQAFDVRTGKRVWVFFTIPQSANAFGANTWQNGSWKYAGHANVWAPIALDEARGLLYLPTTTPSGDYWGGWRPGANLFAESLVCLDANTGERKWHFQAVHHGLWDYDFASPPTLATIRVDGKTIDAVAQVSKQGFTYVFDRVDRPAGLADRRASGRYLDRCPGGTALSHAALPYQAAAARTAGHFARGCERSDARDQGARARATEALPARSAVYAAESARHRAAAVTGRRVELGRRGVRSSERHALRQGGGQLSHQHRVQERQARIRSSTGTTATIAVSQDCLRLGDPRPHRAATAPAPPARADRVPDTVNYSGGQLGGLPLTKPPYAFLVAINLNQGRDRLEGPVR